MQGRCRAMMLRKQRMVPVCRQAVAAGRPRQGEGAQWTGRHPLCFRNIALQLVLRPSICRCKLRIRTKML